MISPTRTILRLSSVKPPSCSVRICCSLTGRLVAPVTESLFLPGGLVAQDHSCFQYTYPTPFQCGVAHSFVVEYLLCCSPMRLRLTERARLVTNIHSILTSDLSIPFIDLRPLATRLPRVVGDIRCHRQPLLIYCTTWLVRHAPQSMTDRVPIAARSIVDYNIEHLTHTIEYTV